MARISINKQNKQIKSEYYKKTNVLGKEFSDRNGWKHKGITELGQKLMKAARMDEFTKIIGDHAQDHEHYPDYIGRCWRCHSADLENLVNYAIDDNTCTIEWYECKVCHEWGYMI